MNETTFFVIAVTLFFTMVGVPNKYAPFIAGLIGIVVTLGLNWSDATVSVEEATDYALKGFGWGMAAVGTHKTISTVRELIEQRDDKQAGSTSQDLEDRR